MPAKCDYKIHAIEPIGYGRAMVSWSVYEGDIATNAEWQDKADGDGSEQVNVTRYQGRSKIAGVFKTNQSEDEATMIRELNTLLQTYVTRSRTAIDEQVNS